MVGYIKTCLIKAEPMPKIKVTFVMLIYFFIILQIVKFKQVLTSFGMELGTPQLKPSLRLLSRALVPLLGGPSTKLIHLELDHLSTKALQLTTILKDECWPNHHPPFGKLFRTLSIKIFSRKIPMESILCYHLGIFYQLHLESK